MKVTDKFQGRMMTNGLALGFAGLTVLLSSLKLTHQTNTSWLLAFAPLAASSAMIMAMGTISVLRMLVEQVESGDENGLILIEADSARQPQHLDLLKLHRVEDL